MRKEHRSFLTTQRLLLAGLTLAAVAVVGLPVKANATTANSTIINVVTVNYSDVAGIGTFSALAASKVTVNLVPSNPNLYAAPSGGGTPGSADCPPILDYPSGTTVSRIYALAATANGKDTYTISVSDYAAGNANTSNYTRSITPLSYNGTAGSTITAPATGTRALKSAIPIGIVGTDTLQFPGGSLFTQGFVANDIVLVEIGPVGSTIKQLFLVSSVSTAANNAPDNSYADAANHTDTSATVRGETLDTLTLVQYDDTTISGQPVGGGGVVPAFGTAATAPTLGVPVGEVALLRVDTTASTSVQSGNSATAGFTIPAYPTDPAPKTCKVDHFLAPTLSIKKEASNFSAAPGVFGATATGNPGQILEYRVTVTNIGGQASLVNVADNVPSYTTLVTNATYGSGTAGTIYAKITDNATAPNSIELTTAVDTEVVAQPLAPVETGFGDAAGTTAASALKFWLGDTASNAAGGKLPYCSNPVFTTAATCVGPASWITTLTILYKVTID